MLRADFSVDREGDVLIVIDNDGPRSVTNDAEAVVEALADRFGLEFDDLRVIYRDTEGRWDELLHIGPMFTLFGPIGVFDRAEALRLVRRSVVTVP